MPRPSARILAYDALRVFAIVSVVAIHVLMPYRQLAAPDSPVRVVDDLLHYAVPLFVFLSGALVWARPLSRERGAYREFLVRRGRLILLPYLAWAALYLALYLQGAADKGAAIAEVPALLLSGHVWYHLYFIPMLLTFYLMTPLTSRLSALVSPGFVVLAAYALRIYEGPDLVAFATSVGGDMAGAWMHHVVTHLPHMALGAWFASRATHLGPVFRRSWPLLLVAGFAVVGAQSAGVLDLSGLDLLLRRSINAAAMAATVLGLVLMAFAFERRYERWRVPITAASAAAFGVYFVHPLFLWLNGRLLLAGNASDLWLQPWFPVAVFVVVTVASFAFAEACARHRRTAWLVGASRNAQRRG